MAVDWSKLEGRYVKFEEGKKKSLIVLAWRNGESKFEGDKESRPALVADVISEDGQPVSKELKVTSFALISKIRPLIEEAERTGKSELSFNVTRVGKGTGTNYLVERN